MDLIEVLDILAEKDNADDIRLNDGAYTWDIYNLMDAVQFDGGDARDYVLGEDGIYAVDPNGYLISPPAYKLLAGEE